MKWAVEHLSWTVEQWSSVLWSDESPFTLRYNQRQCVWRMDNEKYNIDCMTGTVKHDRKINVWGCFAATGVGDLYLINGIMDKNQYKQILTHHMIPSAKELFHNKTYTF